MKIYVAGKWTEIDIINDVQNKLRSQGHTITHDWTCIEGMGDQINFTPVQRLEYDTRCAILDINGVKEADLVFAVMSDKKYPYRGTFTEIGCALGLDKKIIIVCTGDDYYCISNCFFWHPNITHVKTIDEGLELTDDLHATI